MNARGSAMSQPNILRNLSLDVAQATLELLLDLGHLIVAAVKPPKTFDTDKADANEAATACTSGQIHQHLLKSACQDNSRLKVDDARRKQLDAQQPKLPSLQHHATSRHSSCSSCASLHLSPTGPIPAHDRSSPPDPIRSALVESENEALNYSTRIDELTTRISMN
ncbi:hypothetical protein FOWG_17691 [Fusarium oxysporum f. sp. lycopersici MN25]|nr:hypothetical protein FOWG_17691 [Fusarium oxysporum f. sp. lycopersici MN25]